MEYFHVVQDCAKSAQIYTHWWEVISGTEAEGKEYIAGLLHALSRKDIVVTFNDTAKDKTVIEYLETQHKETKWADRNLAQATAIPFGYLPLPKESSRVMESVRQELHIKLNRRSL